MNSKKKRALNMELLRILAMLFIIMHHLIINDIGFAGEMQGNSVLLYDIGMVLESFFIIGVNVFFLISGFFQIKNYSFGKIVSVIMTLYIYMLLIQGLGLLTGYNELNKALIIRLFTTINEYWFIKIYIIVMLFSPILNMLVKQLTEKMASYFFVMYILIFCGVFFVYNDSQVGVNSGYSLLSACSLYIIGASISSGKITLFKERKLRTLWLVYFCSLILNAIIGLISINILHEKMDRLLAYNCPLIVISSVALLVIFAKFDIPQNSKYGKIILFFSTNTLAVYIIHSSNKVIPYYRNILMGYVLEKSMIGAYIFVLPYAIVIFIVCVLIDKVFQRVLGKTIENLSQIIGVGIRKSFSRFLYIEKIVCEHKAIRK